MREIITQFLVNVNHYLKAIEQDSSINLVLSSRLEQIGNSLLEKNQSSQVMRAFITSTHLLCIILCGFSGHAQQEWKIAQVVINDSDTIQGQIAFEDWGQSPKSVQFRDEHGITTSKSVEEIRSFTIHDPLKTFESKNLVLSYYSKEHVPAGTSPIVRTDSVTLFLEVLLRSSRIILYECIDDENQTRFFLQKDGRLHELRNPVYRMSKGETSHLIKSEIYKAQLKELLSECPTLNTQNVSYTDKDIVDLLIKYHTYCKTEYDTETHQEIGGERFAIGAIYRYAPQVENVKNFLGLNALLFSKKKFNSAFVSIDIGVGLGPEEEVSTPAKTNRICFGLYGGKYFGLGEWHPMVFTGISNTNGAFDTGFGLSYQKLIAGSVSVGLIHLTKGDPSFSFQLRITPFSN